MVKIQLTPNSNVNVRLQHTLRGNDGQVSLIAWSPTDCLLASNLGNWTIQIWDVDNGELLREIAGNSDEIYTMAWSPDGKLLAIGSGDRTIELWDVELWKLRNTFEQIGSVWNVAWSPQERILASGSSDKTIRFYDADSDRLVRELKGHNDTIRSIAWSPDGHQLASGSSRLVLLGTDTSSELQNDVAELYVWDCKNGKMQLSLEGHKDSINSIKWSPDGRVLASGSSDGIINIWNPQTGKHLMSLKGHTDSILSLSFSADGRLLASKSADGTIRFWRSDIWQKVFVLKEDILGYFFTEIGFHPSKPAIATLGNNDKEIRIWGIDIDGLLTATPIIPLSQYVNAKVVLMGESSAGKSCLLRALMGKPFKPQKATHGMRVKKLQSDVLKREKSSEIIRETFLWDLAGQTDYQIVHQLFIDETTLAVILFDSTHPENPFCGVEFWEKTVRRIMGKSCPIILVAGRVDLGYPTVTNEDIKLYCLEHNIHTFIPTSSSTGQGILELRKAIKQLIPWDKLPITSSSELWKAASEYLLERRSGEDILTIRSDFQEAFKQKYPDIKITKDEFNRVINNAQKQGLIWQLSFGNYILLKPEKLNNYASAVVIAARKHPQGIGCVLERDIIEAHLELDNVIRIKDSRTERTMLHAVVELFLEKEIALREDQYIVFPSKFNRKRPSYPKPSLPEVVYTFEGTIESIYTTLVVRLNYCGAFKVNNIWKNGAEFTDSGKNTCGFLLTKQQEGKSIGLISIYFDNNTSIYSKTLFLQFIHEHLLKRAVAGSVLRERIYRCLNCGEEIIDKRAIDIRIKSHKRTITCNYCDKQVQLIDTIEEKFRDPELLEIIENLEEQVEETKGQEVGVTKTRAKEDIQEYDVFLAHNSNDIAQVEKIAEALRLRGLNPWLDKEQIPPGRWHQDIIQQAITEVKTAAIIIGQTGLGKWQAVELRGFITQCLDREIPVIPVLLPNVSGFPPELVFLKELGKVNFILSIEESEALDNLEYGITGIFPK